MFQGFYAYVLCAAEQMPRQMVSSSLCFGSNEGLLCLCLSVYERKPGLFGFEFDLCKQLNSAMHIRFLTHLYRENFCLFHRYSL